MEKYEGGNYIYSLHLSLHFAAWFYVHLSSSNLFSLIEYWDLDEGEATQIDQIIGDWRGIIINDFLLLRYDLIFLMIFI